MCPGPPHNAVHVTLQLACMFNKTCNMYDRPVDVTLIFLFTHHKTGWQQQETLADRYFDRKILADWLICNSKSVRVNW